MHKLTHARMTRKASTALQLAYEISGENPIWIRRTRQAVKDCYAYLDRAGWTWVSENRRWEHNVIIERQRSTLAFTVSAMSEDVENVMYVLVESLKAQHYNVLQTTVVSQLTSPGTQTILVVIEP